MNSNGATAALARRVTPRALRNYAQALGWQTVANRNPQLAVFHHPDSKLHQVIVPLDEGFLDYGEMAAEAVARLAAYENRPVQEVLDHLILPPADVVEISDDGPHVLDGTLPLDEAADLIVGARRALLAQAHSVLHPQPFHPRLTRNEAERLVNACRFGQTRRGSFTLTIACPLDAVATDAQLFEQRAPFTRQVTTGLMQALALLADAAEQARGEELLRPSANQLLSANLCEALVMMRPPTDRPSLTISMSWSRSGFPVPDSAIRHRVQLRQESFLLAESLVPRLRSAPHPQEDWFVGFVDALRGVPGEDHRPSGEVSVTLLQEDESLKARLNLSVEDYARANQAHMTTSPVSFRGILYRSLRMGHIDQVRNFQVVSRPTEQPKDPA